MNNKTAFLMGLSATGPQLGDGPVAQAPQLSHKVKQVLSLPVEYFSNRRYRLDAEPMTYAAMVLDESGSMGPHRGSALEGFNVQVNVIRGGAAQAGKTLVSLTTFNSSTRQLLVARPVENLQPLSENQYNPAGGTALFDAIGQTIESMLELPGADNAQTAFLVAIFTDGDENSSRRFSASTLKELVTRLEATGRWTFTLMGPQGSSIELASVLNLKHGNVAMFNPRDKESTRSAFSAMAGAAGAYMSLRSNGVTASASLYAAPDKPD